VLEIKGIVRERGHRTIFAVQSSDQAVDPVGACVGVRGIRIKTVVQQLSGEKIDVVRWSESIEEFTRNILAPARTQRIVLEPTTHRMLIYALPEFRSLIIGRHGLRLEMISRLLGWQIQVMMRLFVGRSCS